jgi:DME family drug/metabolite transporter
VAALIAVVVLGEELPPTGWLGLGLLFISLVITAAPGGRAPATDPIDRAGNPAQGIDRTAPTGSTGLAVS